MHDDTTPAALATLGVALFAGMAAAAGRRRIDLPWTGGTAADVRRLVAEALPALAPLAARSGVAVADRYVTDDAPIAAGDDVALIPPVSGG
jgi:molybdopterin converting factor small subunit